MYLLSNIVTQVIPDFQLKSFTISFDYRFDEFSIEDLFCHSGDHSNGISNPHVNSNSPRCGVHRPVD